MMTDEKRGEIDLETLWRGILRRSMKAREEADAAYDESLGRRDASGQLEDHVRVDVTAAGVDLQSETARA